MIRLLVHHPEAAQHDLSTLRTLAHDGSPIGEAVLERAARVDRTKFPGKLVTGGGTSGMQRLLPLKRYQQDGRSRP